MIASPILHGFWKPQNIITPPVFVPPYTSGALMFIDANNNKCVWADQTMTIPANIGDIVLGVTDFSGNGNHWYMTSANSGSSVTYQIASSDPSKRVLKYPSNGTKYMLFTSTMTTIRTVYWVVSENPTVVGYQFLLGDSSTYNFHSDGDGGCFYNGTYSNVNLLRIDKTDVSIYTLRPTSLKVLSATTSGNSIASEFSRDRLNAYGNRSWVGELQMLLVYSVAHTLQQISDTEDAIKLYLNI